MTLRYISSDAPLLVAALLAHALLSDPVSAVAQDTAERPAPAGSVLSSERLRAAEHFVERTWSHLGLPGVAVSVSTPDSVVLALAHGEGARRGKPMTPHTPFHIGSVTKTLTAAAVAHLAQERELELDAPVEAYLPGFTMREPFSAGSITLRHLLEHTSGLSQWIGHDARAQREGRFDHLAPSGPPGARAEYSSLNFIILGRVLEEATGQPYGHLLDEILFRPLGMRDAFVDGFGERPADLAQGHQSWFGLMQRRAEPLAPRHLVPAGFAGASAHDLGRYGGMLVGGGVFDGARVLDESTVADILGPIDKAGRALSWGRSREDGRLVLEHSGNARTSAARVRLVPEEGYAIVVLTNTNSGPFLDAADTLLDGIDAILDGRPEPRAWPAERLFKGALLVGTVLSVVRMARKAHRWGQAGYPLRPDGSTSTLGRLTLDVGIGAAVLFGVPRLVGVPLSTMVEYFPDLGIGLTVSAGAGVVGGVLTALTRSAP